MGRDGCYYKRKTQEHLAVMVPLSILTGWCLFSVIFVILPHKTTHTQPSINIIIEISIGSMEVPMSFPTSIITSLKYTTPSMFHTTLQLNISKLNSSSYFKSLLLLTLPVPQWILLSFMTSHIYYTTCSMRAELFCCAHCCIPNK